MALLNGNGFLHSCWAVSSTIIPLFEFSVVILLFSMNCRDILPIHLNACVLEPCIIKKCIVTVVSLADRYGFESLHCNLFCFVGIHQKF